MPRALQPLFLAFPVLAACGGGDQARRPDVILISLDTLRADHMGLYGYERDTTPYLDRLADECLVFDNAYSTAPWTLVAHMTMLTGLYPRQHGVWERELALSPETPLLAERLRQAGYQTVGLHFSGWVHERHGFDRGFDVFRSHKNAEEAERHLTEELAALDPERPTFLFLHLFDIHCGTLTDAPGPVYDTPSPFDEAFMDHPAARLTDATEGQIWSGKKRLTPPQIEALVALYDGGIRYVDSKLEAWIEDWRAEGRLDRALLIITADHGEGLGQRGRIDGHGTVYQEGLRVPLLVRRPGGTGGGRRVHEVVSLVDLVPTVLESVGIVANDLAGHSVFDPPAARTVLAFQPARETAIRWPRKIVHTRKGQTITANLESDPLELSPTRGDVSELELWRASVLGTAAELARWPRAVPIDLDPADMDDLKALGYGGEDE